MEPIEVSVVGACEAEIKFSKLLKRVAVGEEITITQHGKPIARLIPVRPTHSMETRREAILKMRELAARNSLGGLRIRDLIAEERR